MEGDLLHHWRQAEILVVTETRIRHYQSLVERAPKRGGGVIGITGMIHL